MSIFTDMFKPKTESASAPESKSLSDPAPPTNEAGKMPGSDGTQVNPLDAYKKMYENANASSDIKAPEFKLDPKVLGEVSKNMDFTKGVAPELLDKALQGDAKSLLAVISSVGQNAYSASLEHATALTETHLSNRADYESKKINSGVKEQLTTSALSSAPNYDHPVVKAELNRVAKMFAANDPDASPQQIAQAAQKHLQDLASALAPQKTAEEKATESGEIDWSKYLS